MSARRPLLALAVVCGIVAAAIYQAGAARTDVVVFAHDVEIPRPLTLDDLSVRSVASALVPQDALRSTDEGVGLLPRGVVLAGQVVSARLLARDLDGLRAGVTLAPGLRAIAVPADAVTAVGGAVIPGSRVDVLAIPILGRAPAGRTAELLLTNALVLDVRSDTGGAYVPKDARVGAVPERIASVVIAIAATDEVRFADRIATSTFVLALSGAR